MKIYETYLGTVSVFAYLAVSLKAQESKDSGIAGLGQNIRTKNKRRFNLTLNFVIFPPICPAKIKTLTEYWMNKMFSTMAMFREWTYFRNTFVSVAVAVAIARVVLVHSGGAICFRYENSFSIQSNNFCTNFYSYIRFKK